MIKCAYIEGTTIKKSFLCGSVLCLSVNCLLLNRDVFEACKSLAVTLYFFALGLYGEIFYIISNFLGITTVIKMNLLFTYIKILFQKTQFVKKLLTITNMEKYKHYWTS